MLLKHYLDQGVSKTDLSRRFGINPRTIHYWIKTGQLNRDLSTGARGTRRDRPLWITASGEWINVNGGAKRDHLGGVRRDRLAAAGLSP